jgi:hypothetical protein
MERSIADVLDRQHIERVVVRPLPLEEEFVEVGSIVAVERHNLAVENRRMRSDAVRDFCAEHIPTREDVPAP